MMWSKGSQSSGFRLTEVHLRHLCLPVAYDANGNTLSDAQGRSYTWDFENRLTQAVVPGANGGTTTFRYDPFGRRIQKSGPLGTTNYLYSGSNVINALSASGSVIAAYVQGQGVDAPLAQSETGTQSYYEADGLGSLTSFSNSAAALANTITYDSYGNVIGSTGTLNDYFRYTGREFDQETNIYYYRTRYYDPSIGRFLSEDGARLVGGVNFYRYVRDNPVNLNDPLGTCPDNKCAPSGNAPNPDYYANRALQGDPTNLEQDTTLPNLLTALNFYRGGSMDAQAQGASAAYANYVYGVYMCAAGWSLEDALQFANIYGFWFSNYKHSKKARDPNWPALPAVNVANITKGCNDEQVGTLCTTN
jgi:RHS repeat-associated protein